MARLGEDIDYGKPAKDWLYLEKPPYKENLFRSFTHLEFWQISLKTKVK